jgi:acetyltransferase-like isoleucine patch superfamily enzyme
MIASVAHGREPRAFPVLGEVLFRLYGLRMRVVRSLVHRLVVRLEGGTVFSVTLRRIFSTYHQVDVGMYTHGGAFIVDNMAPATVIGRYSSIAETARTFTRNHPMNTKSTSALFFNQHFGVVKDDPVGRGKLTIGNDVWIGHNATILPSVTSIGDGAVIGAGAVVHRNIPPYAVVTGHPCRIVRYRFSEEMVARLLASRWWEKSLDALRPDIGEFLRPLEEETIR